VLWKGNGGFAKTAASEQRGAPLGKASSGEEPSRLSEFGGALLSRGVSQSTKWDEVPAEYGAGIGPAGVAKAKAARPKELGNTREEIMDYRDRMLLALLKLHGKI
jgi:hypothetical protein